MALGKGKSIKNQDVMGIVSTIFVKNRLCLVKARWRATMFQARLAYPVEKTALREMKIGSGHDECLARAWRLEIGTCCYQTCFFEKGLGIQTENGSIAAHKLAKQGGNQEMVAKQKKVLDRKMSLVKMKISIP